MNNYGSSLVGVALFITIVGLWIRMWFLIPVGIVAALLGAQITYLIEKSRYYKSAFDEIVEYLEEQGDERV